MFLYFSLNKIVLQLEQNEITIISSSAISVIVTPVNQSFLVDEFFINNGDYSYKSGR